MVQRHGTDARRQAVRAGHGGLVLRPGVARAVSHIGDNPDVLRALSAALRAGLPARALRRRLRRARRGRALRDRRRGAVRRHGPFRQAADPPGLVRHRDARAGAELLRPGRDAARRAREGRQSVLRDGAGLGAVPADRPGDLRDGDRLAGADHRGVLGHQAGDPARLPAAPAHPAHLGQGDRPDLPAVRQLGPVRRHRARGRPVRLERQARPPPTASR